MFSSLSAELPQDYSGKTLNVQKAPKYIQTPENYIVMMSPLGKSPFFKNYEIIYVIISQLKSGTNYKSYFQFLC